MSETSSHTISPANPPSTNRLQVPLFATVLAILYSTALNLSLPKAQAASPLPLPLRHTSLVALLAQVIWESIFIGRLSDSASNSFGAGLHLLKFPLLLTVYRQFNVEFKTQILNSLAFDAINYYGQFVIFRYFSATKKIVQSPVRDPEAEQDRHKKIEARNGVVMAVLSWMLISLVDGVSSFIAEKLLVGMIEKDVNAYLRKLELDQYFLLQSSSAISASEILRPSSRDQPMIHHQLLSPLINIPYLFSSASLISLPTDLVLLDRLPMLSLDTRTRWVAGLVTRRLINGAFSWFFRS